MEQDQNAKTPAVPRKQASSSMAWRNSVIVFGILIILVVNAAIIALYAYEWRPRERLCLMNVRKIADLLEKFIYLEPKRMTLSSDGAQIVQSFQKLMELGGDEVDFNLVYFKCPFSDSPPGKSDYVSMDGVELNKDFMDLPVLWEREVFHGTGRYVIICDKYLSFDVKYVEENDFQNMLVGLKKSISELKTKSSTEEQN